MSSSHDYKIAAEEDIDPRANKHIYGYLVIMGITLFLVILGLTIMFRFQVDYEKRVKIGEVDTKEVLDYRARMENILSGNGALFSDKKNVSIDYAIKKTISDSRKGR